MGELRGFCKAFTLFDFFCFFRLNRRFQVHTFRENYRGDQNAVIILGLIRTGVEIGD